MRLVVAMVIALAVTGCSSSGAPASELPGPGAEVPPVDAVASASAPRGPERVSAARPPARPDEPELAADFVPILVEDHCVDRDLSAPAAGDPALTILDRSYALPATYAPPDLVSASTAGLDGASGTKLLRAVVIDDLADMVAAWEAAGLEIAIESAYRSHASQAGTFEAWVARLGPAAAMTRTARPGHSEHQLGTALDLTSPGWSGRFGDWATETPEGRWMAEHAWEYGFVMSYPPGFEASTCFGYEPWHYRWIGRDLAAEQRASGLDLRRFLERHAGG